MAQSNIPHSNKVLVVIRASCRKLDRAALTYAFEQVVQPGDRLIIIGIIDRIPTLYFGTSISQLSFSENLNECRFPVGWKKATIEDGFNATNEITLARLKTQASNEFEAEFYPDSKLCDERQILLEFIIDSGKSYEVLLHHAIELQPRCIVLDRDLKDQKDFCAGRLTCDVFLMKKDGRARKLVASGTARHVHNSENVDKVKIMLGLFFTRTPAA